MEQGNYLNTEQKEGACKGGNLSLESYKLHLGPHAEVQSEMEILGRD